MVLNANSGNVGEGDSNRSFIRGSADVLPGRTVTNPSICGIEVLWPAKVSTAAAPIRA